MMTVSELYKKRGLLKARLERLEAHGSHDSISSSYSPSTPNGLVSEIANSKRQNNRRNSSEFKSIHPTRDTDHLLSLSETIENGTALKPAQLVSLRGLLTKEIQRLSEGLQGQFSTHNQYPRNLTVGNFCEFITLPTLVYELEYPRTERIDWAYVAEKVVATFATIFVMIVVSQYWIYPVVMKTLEMKEQGLTVQQRLQEFPWVLSDLLFPFMMEYLLAFYVIWECVVSITSPLCCLFKLPHRLTGNVSSSTLWPRSLDSLIGDSMLTGGTLYLGINLPVIGIDRCITSCYGTFITAPSAHFISPAFRQAW